MDEIDRRETLSDAYYGGDRRRADPMTAWEKHGQTILAGIVVIILSWVGVTVSDNAKRSAVMGQQIVDLKIQLGDMERSLHAEMADRYRGKDATRDFQAVYKELDRVKGENFTFMKEQAARGPRIQALEIGQKKLENEIKDIKRAIGKQ